MCIRDSFATETVVAFILLRNSRFNFHCYTQREATPTRNSARKWRCDLSRLRARKITKGIHSCKPASLNRPIERFWRGPRSPRQEVCGWWWWGTIPNTTLSPPAWLLRKEGQCWKLFYCLMCSHNKTTLEKKRAETGNRNEVVHLPSLPCYR